MKKLHLFGLLLAAILLFAAETGARTYTPAEMPNVQIKDSTQLVSDPGNLLSASERAEINRMLRDIRSTTTCEVVVALPPSIGDADEQQWCEQLFTLWGIGKRDRDNGVLIMISPESRCCFIMTGYGAEGALPDILCRRIIDRSIIPAMRDDNLYGAVKGSVKGVGEALEDPSVAEELRSKQAAEQTALAERQEEMREILYGFLALAVIVFFTVAAALLIAALVGTRGKPHERAKKLLGLKKGMLILAVLSVGAALPVLLIWYLCYSRARYHQKCPSCGRRMRLLSGAEGGQYLPPERALEQRLGSVRFDVWKCPECHRVEVKGFPNPNSVYKECPVCHTRAMKLRTSRVEIQPTVSSEGVGVKEYVCEYCGHNRQERYKIPRKDDAALLAALGAASMAGRRRGGRGGFGGGGFGGFGGGGFGGGHTGGGGAGGRW